MKKLIMLLTLSALIQGCSEVVVKEEGDAVYYYRYNRGGEKYKFRTSAAAYTNDGLDITLHFLRVNK